MLPPIIRTTPNSPTVWAKARTSPASTAGHDKGSTIVMNVRGADAPRQRAASSSRRSTAAKPDANGRTANGKVVQHRRGEDAGKGKRNRSVEHPRVDTADGAVWPGGHEQVEAKHGRRQEQRHRDRRIDERSPRARRGGQPVRERQPDDGQDQGRERRKLHRQADSDPVHATCREARSRMTPSTRRPSVAEEIVAELQRRLARGGPRQDQAALRQRWMRVLRNIPRTAAAHRRRQGQRLPDDCRVGSTALRELRRLRHVLAKHELPVERSPYAGVAQRRLGRASVWSEPWIRNGDAIWRRSTRGDRHVRSQASTSRAPTRRGDRWRR